MIKWMGKEMITLKKVSNDCVYVWFICLFHNFNKPAQNEYIMQITRFN